MTPPLRVLCIGAGNMGASHAKAYTQIPGFTVCGVVTRSPASRERLITSLGLGCPGYGNVQEALDALQPDAVSISSYPDTHAAYALAALDAGAHVFVEKPIAETVADAQAIADKARAAGRKVVVGYILRHSPGWQRFIATARTLGKPLVMRMNLNQQSCGKAWETHRALMSSISPIVDCGVHYVDVMCQMTQAKPVRVSGIGARLSDALPAGRINYGHLQVTFDDGSVGWYEAGWGPMMSQTAFFVKDVVGPKGSATITAEQASGEGESANVDAHTQTQSIRLHTSALDAQGAFREPDTWIRTDDEPDHDGLCRHEQEYFLQAIQDDLDLTRHLNDAINSMRIVLAADESFRTGETVRL